MLNSEESTQTVVTSPLQTQVQEVTSQSEKEIGGESEIGGSDLVVNKSPESVAQTQNSAETFQTAKERSQSVESLSGDSYRSATEFLADFGEAMPPKSGENSDTPSPGQQDTEASCTAKPVTSQSSVYVSLTTCDTHVSEARASAATMTLHVTSSQTHVTNSPTSDVTSPSHLSPGKTFVSPEQLKQFYARLFSQDQNPPNNLPNAESTPTKSITTASPNLAPAISQRSDSTDSASVRHSSISADDVIKTPKNSEVDEFILNTSLCSKTARRRPSRDPSTHSNTSVLSNHSQPPPPPSPMVTAPSNESPLKPDDGCQADSIDSNGELFDNPITPVRRRKRRAPSPESESEWSQAEEAEKLLQSNSEEISSKDLLQKRRAARSKAGLQIKVDKGKSLKENIQNALGKKDRGKDGKSNLDSCVLFSKNSMKSRKNPQKKLLYAGSEKMMCATPEENKARKKGQSSKKKGRKLKIRNQKSPTEQGSEEKGRNSENEGPESEKEGRAEIYGKRTRNAKGRLTRYILVCKYCFRKSCYMFYASLFLETQHKRRNWRKNQRDYVTQRTTAQYRKRKVKVVQSETCGKRKYRSTSTQQTRNLNRVLTKAHRWQIKKKDFL